MMNKITKKQAMELLNGKVQFIGSYINIDSEYLFNFLNDNLDRVNLFLDKAEIRECVSQSNTQIKFRLPNNEYSYLTQITNSKWYLATIDKYKVVILEGKDGFTIGYNIVEG